MANPLNVNPTRQELLTLKKKLKRAVRGHKLLEDKRDGLMKEFMGLVREVISSRAKIEKEIRVAFSHFLFASALSETKKIKPIFKSRNNPIRLRLEKKNIMGVETYKFGVEEDIHPSLPKQNDDSDNDAFAYSLISTNHDLDISTIAFKEVFNDLLKLAEQEHAAKLLAQEIEKTRRRVNALEYVLIPKTQETIKYIDSKIGERERGTIVTLMKLKKRME